MPSGPTTIPQPLRQAGASHILTRTGGTLRIAFTAATLDMT